jgi:hypothetical protein
VHGLAVPSGVSRWLVCCGIRAARIPKLLGANKWTPGRTRKRGDAG